MSSREQKLLILFAVAGFVMVNLVGLSLYNKKSADLDSRKLKAERALMDLNNSQAMREARLAEMDWLDLHLPEPAEYQNVQTALQTYCVAEANRFKLTYKGEEALSRESRQGTHFHRVGIRFKVTGMEEDLYRWLDRISMPDQFRGVTRLILSPNKEDDTRIDCTATVEQWFVPAGPSA